MEIVGYITTTIVVIFICGVAVAMLPSFLASFFKNKKLLKLAGTAIPELGKGFDVTKRYDVVFSGGDYGSQFVDRLEGIKIIGYVGKEDDEVVGKGYMRSRWLVVEFADARRAYLMPHAVISLREAAETKPDSVDVAI